MVHPILRSALVSGKPVARNPARTTTLRPSISMEVTALAPQTVK